jgi:hypothetical protein
MQGEAREVIMQPVHPSGLLPHTVLRVAIGVAVLGLVSPSATDAAARIRRPLLQAAPRAAPPSGVPARAAIWVGQAAQMEAHLRTAAIAGMEEIGTGVTRPKRAHLQPAEPFESLVWKPLPPGRRSGHWESYKSEIAAYELDKLLEMDMVPPVVEREIDGERGAAVMWLPSMKSVKQSGGKMPAGAEWGRSTRRMVTFDNFIGNDDRNAGNILLGSPGELILIDHSRAFVTGDGLPRKIERVDAQLWGRIRALTRDDLVRVLGPWMDSYAIDAMLNRREKMSAAIDKLAARKSRALVVID